MSELTLTILKLGLFLVLWLFVVSLVAVLRGDLYGTRVVNRVTTRTPAAGGAVAGPQSDTRPRRRDRRTPVGDSLVVTSGQLAGTRLPLGDGDFLIGRSPECLLVVDDDFASGRHARIFRTETGWAIEDLGSTNGTFVEDQRIGEPTVIEFGTPVRVGRTTLELQR